MTKGDTLVITSMFILFLNRYFVIIFLYSGEDGNVLNNNTQDLFYHYSGKVWRTFNWTVWVWRKVFKFVEGWRLIPVKNICFSLLLRAEEINKFRVGKKVFFCLFSSDPQRERVRCWVEIVKQFLTEFSLVEQSSRGQVSPRSHSSWTIKLSWHVRGPGLGLALKTKRTLQHQISAGDLQGKPRKGKKYAIGGPPKNSILFLLFCLAVA